jgi:glyoxylase-like metal-dependent hydrolase (beta-lactamase superfamily II)
VDLGTPDGQQAVLEALNRRGIEPGDIDSIVLTHRYIDHVGALGLFPGTSIIVPEGTGYGQPPPVVMRVRTQIADTACCVGNPDVPV